MGSYHMYLSSRFALEPAPKEGVLWALSCQAIRERLLLTDIRVGVLWSRRVAAF